MYLTSVTKNSDSRSGQKSRWGQRPCGDQWQLAGVTLPICSIPVLFVVGCKLGDGGQELQSRMGAGHSIR